MKPFCEIVVSRIFPVLRALLAKELAMMGHTQMEIASSLGITQPAISQYRRRLRGKNAKLLENNEVFMREIKSAAMAIAKDRNAYAREMCRLCRFLRESKLICIFCPEFRGSESACDACNP